jgi:putative ABC transport system permease protein
MIRRPVARGRKLADLMGAKLNSKVTLQFQTPAGDFFPISFRVGGIFKTKSGFYDQSTVFVRLSDIRANAELSEAGVQEIAILTDDFTRTDEYKSTIAQAAFGLTTQTWKEIAPEIGYAYELIDIFLFIFMGIIMLALAFGILNLMLMAVLERTRELGMIMALGMNRGRVFRLIMLETVMLAMTAAPFGLLLGGVTVSILSHTGVDLSIVSQGLAAFGIDTVIYPLMPLKYYFYMVLMVVGTALITAIFPALRAIRLSPAEATRKS